MPPGPRVAPPLAPPPAAAASGQTGRPGCGSSGGSKLDSPALGGKKRQCRHETQDVKRFFSSIERSVRPSTGALQ